MSSEAKPREWWIVRHFKRPGVIELQAHETKPSWDSMQLGDERIHVLEAAPTTLAAAEMREALRYCKGTIEQLVNAHTQNGAWKEANALLLRIQSAEAGRAKGGV